MIRTKHTANMAVAANVSHPGRRSYVAVDIDESLLVSGRTGRGRPSVSDSRPARPLAGGRATGRRRRAAPADQRMSCGVSEAVAPSGFIIRHTDRKSTRLNSRHTDI